MISLYIGGMPSGKPLEALRRFGADAVSFQGLESAMQWWFDDPPPSGTGAAVAYLDTGRAWIAAGRPLVDEVGCHAAAVRFATAARAEHRRAVFFGAERIEAFAGFRRMSLGLQSTLDPSSWDNTLRKSRKLREQLRRARVKGVTVRIADAHELAPGAWLRHEVERLRASWLAARPMEPMGFLVAVEPFHEPEAHLYLVAERDGRAVQFLSAVPIYARQGWLLEDMLRGPDAPNGTTEIIIDRLMREVCEHASIVTPGLTPLIGEVSWWLRGVSVVTRPLYDFEGLRRFRARLSPQRWDPIWLVWDRGPAVAVLLDVLRAFANGRLLAFAACSLTRHPNGPPWAVAVPLVPWTLLLILLVSLGHADVLAYSSAALAGWIVFDSALAVLLFRTARHPRIGALATLTVAAGCDAVISVTHLLRWGISDHPFSIACRLAATAGPLIGTTALAWATHRASKYARR